MCFIGKYTGTQNKYFEQLYAKKAWLMEAQEPPLDSQGDRKVIPRFAEEFYDERAYEEMVICVGEALIENHEIDKFKDFFYSQNCLYMTSKIVTALLSCCLQYMIPECLVPIYALCNNQFEY